MCVFSSRLGRENFSFQNLEITVSKKVTYILFDWFVRQLWGSLRNKVLGKFGKHLGDCDFSWVCL